MLFLALGSSFSTSPFPLVYQAAEAVMRSSGAFTSEQEDETSCPGWKNDYTN